MLRAPSGRREARDLLERVRERRLLRKPEQLRDLRHRKRAVAKEILGALRPTPADIGAQGLACLGLEDGAELGAARVEVPSELVDAHAPTAVERTLDSRGGLFGEARARPRARSP